MLRTTTFFTGIDLIEIPLTSARGERFADLYYITTDRERISEIVTPFKSEVGNVEASYLMSGGAKALIYRISKKEIDETDVASSLDQLLTEDMSVVKWLQQNLWIIQDNAAHFDRSWIMVSISPAKTVVTTNTWKTRQTCSDGTFDTVSYGVEELRAARRIPKGPVVDIMSEQTATMLTSKSLRYERFLYFVDIGRSSADVAMKIAQYCSGLEALVSTAHTELSHQVAERVAVVLATPGGSRITLFKQVKEAYGFRSKAVHGAAFKPKDAARLRECAKRLDQVCRDLVYTYFDQNSGFRAAIDGSDNVTDDFFVNKVLGSETGKSDDGNIVDS